MAFLGSFNILTIISLSSPCSVKIMGSLPINSGIIPNSLKSSGLTCLSIADTSLSVSFMAAPYPIPDCLLILFLMVSSRSGKAPPQMNSIFLVLTVTRGTMPVLELAPTGTSISAPSNSLSIPCCTDSPLTSRVRISDFLAILSISSMKTMPCSAFSTSLSAAARSLLITLSISSPM